MSFKSTTTVLDLFSCFPFLQAEALRMRALCVPWYLLAGWQCPASPAVNPSGWTSKPIV